MNILIDFDGVILDSNRLKEEGFREVLGSYPKDDVEELLKYHKANGGISRYVKFRYFFETIQNKSADPTILNNLAEQFSEMMRRELVNPRYLIADTHSFLKSNYSKFPIHVVSGADQEELIYLCEQLGIKSYFSSIHGSPTPKEELIRQLLIDYGYKNGQTIMIGDALNDYQAASENGIEFIGYNNPELKKLKSLYLGSFSDLVPLLAQRGVV